ncbi:MAG: hypothetical protein QM725_10295 [Lacibacter sp.]
MDRVYFFIVCICFFNFSFAQNALTNGDIVNLKVAKVDDDVIITKISSSKTNFDLSAQGLIGLKTAKIPEKIIISMLNIQRSNEKITNDDIINLTMSNVSDRIIKEKIKTAPRSFDVSTEGIIKLKTAKVSKDIVKEMMQNSGNAETSNVPSSSETKVNSDNPSSDKVLRFSDVENSKTLFKTYDMYIAQDGSVFAKGDKITVKAPSSNGRVFQYIYETKGLSGVKNYLDARYSNRELTILFISVENSGTSLFSSKKFKVAQIVAAGTGGMLSNINIDIENAISSSEIKSKVISETEALEKIKNAKDKYELGLITKKEYEEVVEEMKKYIKH